MKRTEASSSSSSSSSSAASGAAASTAVAPAAATPYSSTATAGFRTRRGRVSIDYEKVKEETEKQTQKPNRPQLMSGTAFAQSPLATLVMIEYHILQAHIETNARMVSAKNTSNQIDKFLLESRKQKVQGWAPLALKLNPDLSDDEELDWRSDTEK